MKKIAFVVSLILISSGGLKSQDKSTTTATLVPVDPITKLITYEGVVEVKGASASILYTRALEWFNINYKNPTDVIRENDEAGHKIVGKHRFKIMNPPDKSGARADAGLVQYTITISSRDGRFKYELTEFSWKQLSVYPCERWLDKSAAGYLPVYPEYLSQIDSEMLELIAAFKNSITHEKPVKDKDTW